MVPGQKDLWSQCLRAHSTGVPSSLGTGHPGTNQTLSLLQDHFWWHSMAQDMRMFIQGHKECTISKSLWYLPFGKILPLPIPHWPFSHLGVDFIIDLPPSDRCTCILVIINRFSNACRLVPLKGSSYDHGNSWDDVQLCLAQLCRTRHSLRSRCSTYLPVLESLFHPSRCVFPPVTILKPTGRQKGRLGDS